MLNILDRKIEFPSFELPSIKENSLMELEAKGIIEKYEMDYRTVNLYISNFENSEMIDMDVQFRALYPVEITGLSVRAYDYYNPQVEGNSLPIAIKVN